LAIEDITERKKTGRRRCWISAKSEHANGSDADLHDGPWDNTLTGIGFHERIVGKIAWQSTLWPKGGPGVGGEGHQPALI